MDKETLLKHYIEIEQSANSKKIKQRLVKELIKKTGEAAFTFQDITFISTKLFKIESVIHLDFFSTILYPIIKKEIELENINAIQLLLQFNSSLIKYVDKKYSSYDLIKKGLSIDPNNSKLLNTFKKDAEAYIKYTIHEVPAGILYDTNGATIEQCDELLEYLEEYKSVCSKLNVAESVSIHNAGLYYNSYKTYLTNKDKFEDFEHYLRDTWIKSKK